MKLIYKKTIVDQVAALVQQSTQPIDYIELTSAELGQLDREMGHRAQDTTVSLTLLGYRVREARA